MNINKDEVSIIIGGDVYPGNSYMKLFEEGEIDHILGSLKDDFNNADYKIINLESPLIDTYSPIKKSGPVLGATRKCINGIAKLNVNLINLANNHIMDHGEDGLKSTIELCNSKGISIVGAGKNIREACKIHNISFNGLTIGIMSIAENEFSIAKENSYGAAPFDIINNSLDIIRNRKLFDYFIILFHGGNEYYQFPSPMLKKRCRFFIDMGANAVIVQHTHCIGSYDYYKNGHIVYGQGNLVFDLKNKHDMFYEGMLVKLYIKKESSRIEFIPFFQTKKYTSVIKMDNDEIALFNKVFNERNELTQDDNFLINNWRDFCLKNKHEYFSNILCHNKIIRLLNCNGYFERLLYSKKLYTTMRNSILCESHHDVLNELFNMDANKLN